MNKWLRSWGCYCAFHLVSSLSIGRAKMRKPEMVSIVAMRLSGSRGFRFNRRCIHNKSTLAAWDLRSRHPAQMKRDEIVDIEIDRALVVSLGGIWLRRSPEWWFGLTLKHWGVWPHRHSTLLCATTLKGWTGPTFQLNLEEAHWRLAQHSWSQKKKNPKRVYGLQWCPLAAGPGPGNCFPAALCRHHQLPKEKTIISQQKFYILYFS